MKTQTDFIVAGAKSTKNNSFDMLNTANPQHPSLTAALNMAYRR